jgi:hypothetical protein
VNSKTAVMAGLDPAIYVFLVAPKTWMPATSAGMTSGENQPNTNFTRSAIPLPVPSGVPPNSSAGALMRLTQNVG